MSRVIVNDHPWSLNEQQYFIDRDRLADVEANIRDYPPGQVDEVKPDAAPKISEDIFEYVKGLEVEQLKSDLLSAGLEATGTERDLKVRLALHLQGEKDSQ